MGKRIVILQGHPDPGGGHFDHALGRAYAEGARTAGHVVEQVEIAALDFPWLKTKEDFETGVLPEGLAAAHRLIADADHIVLIFPLWLGTMPAIVKAFLEQVMRPGLAFAYQEHGLPRKLLAGRSARVVVTMGMPAVFYRWFYGAHGIRGLRRNILNFVGIRPVRETLIGLVEGMSERKRKGWLREMKALGRRAR